MYFLLKNIKFYEKKEIEFECLVISKLNFLFNLIFFIKVLNLLGFIEYILDKFDAYDKSADI